MSKSTKTSIGLKAALSLSVGLSALATGGTLAAMAQDEAAEEDKRLNTVTITATKREQTLQDVPVAVSVVDDSVIEKAEILDLNDLQSVVPSLGFRTFQNSVNANFTIRGFGNGANNAGIEPSVGIFIDGVYRSRAASQIGDLPNIQRVEVLRGPQSTLFGKNASAGVVSVVTRKPEYELGGNVEGSLGNLGLQRTKGYVTGPITENLAFSLGGGYNKRDGTATEVETGDELNERDRWNLRGELLFEPTENQEWRLIADIDEIDEVCCVATNLINGGATDAIVQALGGQLVAEDPYSRDIALNRLPSNFVRNQGVSLHGDIEFNGFTFTTITSYRETLAKVDYDIDYTSGDLASLNDRLELETFTQEVRFTSNGEGPVDWMVGGFYFDEDVSQRSQLSYDSDFRDFLNISAALGGATDPATVGAVTGAFSAGLLPDTLCGVEMLLGLPGG
ncbi:MAG: TonB-dependent receptor plug domain-containing protein, partial [Pseudomonadota bacterium]